MLVPTRGADTPEALAVAVGLLAPAVVEGCRAAEAARVQLTPVTVTDREMTSGCQQAFVSAPQLATLWANGAYASQEAQSALQMLQMTQSFCPGWRRAEATAR